MNASTEMISDWLQTAKFTAPVLDALVKSFVVMLAAGGLCLICRRASAATRHLIWFLALGGLPCLVLLSALPRPWQRPLWSVSTAFNSGNQVSVALELAPATLDRNASTALLASPLRAETSKTSQARTKANHPPGIRASASWLAFAGIVGRGWHEVTGEGRHEKKSFFNEERSGVLLR